jgi:FKBP-type peptidyl-prolyl cis-trans isomerase SlyD
MKIGPDTVVSISYNLYDEEGKLLEATTPEDPFIFAFGREMIVPGLERALEGMEPGQSIDVTVAPEDAYGPREPGLVQQIPRAQFPDDVDLEVGMQYRAVTDAGNLIIFAVVGLDDQNVEIDLNHPLAGETLRFEVQVVEVSSEPQGLGQDGPQLWVPGDPV